MMKRMLTTLLGLVAATGVAIASDLADGEVRKVDREAHKITIKHGKIKNLEMPPMTMVFQVKQAALLDKVKPGDKIRFKAVNESGQVTLTQVEVVR